MNKEWNISPAWDGCADAARRWNVPPLVAQILYNRGVPPEEDAGPFLDPKLRDLHPPRMLPGARDAACRIAAAVRAGKRILIYGDYDVDGITAVAILWHLLRLAGADPRFYVPHRVDEGYGLNSDALRTIAADGAELVITVDCGITACAEAALARQLGLELIVTDHHTLGPELPDAAARVHPGLEDGYPNRDLSGSGVAMKAAWATAQELCGADRVSAEYRAFLMTIALPLAALGTIADVVPLVGENRIIARHGLAALRACPLPGISALIESAGLTGAAIEGYDVGFKLAPRLNAAGRMGNARLAVDLLTHADAARARDIAVNLEEQNRGRQAVERKTSRQAFEMIERERWDADSRRGIVVAGEGWHAGIIGLVAARVVGRYHKPAVAITLDNGAGQGSGRSIGRFNLHGALHACRDHLQTFGGHAMAAGLKLETRRLEDFREAFVCHANKTLTAADLRPRLHLDAEASLDGLDVATVSAISNLGPFGTGNPQPLLASGWLDLQGEPRTVGKNGDHLQATFSQDGRVSKAIAFGQAAVADRLKQHRRCKLAFEPIINEWNGRRTVEMQVVDFKFPD